MHQKFAINRRQGLAALAAPFLAPAMAQVATWPSKPIRLITPSAAGSPLDILARIYADSLRTQFNQPVLVDNKPGANQTIGIQALLSSAADGHSFLIASTEVVRVPLLYSSTKYDALNDLVPLAHTARVAVHMCVPSSLGPSTVAEFVDLAKKSPAPLSFGAPGQWSATHFYAMQFEQQAGIKLTHVPYKAEPLMLTDLFTGQLAAGFFASPQILQFEKEGKLRILASAGITRRSAAYQNLPTFHELGYRGLDIPGFVGIFGASGIPPAVAERASAEFAKVTMRPDVQSRIDSFGWEPPSGDSQAEFAKVVRVAHEGWSKTIRQANVKVE